MTITKMYQIMMIFFLTYKRSLAQSANSQQPTANSQQPTANSQQPTSNFYSNNFIFRYIYFANKSNLGFYSVAALFLCLFGQGVQKITN